MGYIVAFDISMGKSSIVIYDANKCCLYEGEIEHTVTHFHQLHQQLQSLTEETGKQPAIIFEATGSYSGPLERFLQDHQYFYYRLNPLEAKLQTASMRRQKSDRNDAHELAKSHFTATRRLTTQQENYYDQMRALSRYYDELDDEIMFLMNRIHALIQLSFPMLENIFSRSSAMFLKMVEQYPHPELVLTEQEEVLIQKVRESTNKNYSMAQAGDKVKLLKEKASNTYSAISTTDVRCQQLKNYAKRVYELRVQKKALVHQMVELSANRSEYQVLISFPGIGETTAVRLIGELGDIRRFENHKQLNAYVGIDVQRYQSGKLEYRDRINKRGNRQLRKILFFMVMSMISLRKKTNNHLVEYYDRLKKQPQSKPHKVAVIACMNKFLKIAYHLIHHNLLYDYETASTCS